MAEQKKLHAPAKQETGPGAGFEPEGESSLLREARGWAGAGREAAERVKGVDASDIVQMQRKQGPGQ